MVAFFFTHPGAPGERNDRDPNVLQSGGPVLLNAEDASVLDERTARRPLTIQQRETLEYWAMFTCAKGYPPTLREAQEKFGLASSYAVSCRVRWLRVRGLLARGFDAKDKSRNVVITPLGHHVIGFDKSKRVTGTADFGHKCFALGCPATLFRQVEYCPEHAL